MIEDFWQIAAVGFAAQMVDGALGMGYGLTSTSLLLTLGYSPAAASAAIHLAETATTAVSAGSHHVARNVDWSDDVIDAKTRSMLNLSMIRALGKMHEWAHCCGALNNRVTQDEIRAIIHVIGIYCGVLQALECFRVARKVMEDV